VSPGDGGALRVSIRILVFLTSSLLLAMAVFGGQVWWARRLATIALQQPVIIENKESLIRSWEAHPWCGIYGEKLPNYRGFLGWPAHLSLGRKTWIPRRTYYELLKLTTGQDLGNDPSAWRTWFKNHPNLRWDKSQKWFVDR